MVALDVSGKLVLSFLIAIAQFFEPVTPEQLAVIEQNKTLTPYEKSIYTFQSLSSSDLKNLSNHDLAVYLRTACARFRNEAILTEDSFLSGRLVELSTLDFVANTMDMETLSDLGSNLLPGEEFDPQSGIRLLIKTCEDKDPRFPLEVLEQNNLQEAVDFYQSFENQLPVWNSSNDLPQLPQMYIPLDSKGQPLGDLFSVETVRKGDSYQVVRRNRRINATADEIPQLMMKALVSIEDAQFWNFQPEGTAEYRGHGGFDPRGTLRAGKTTASGDGVQGGSTITMQLLKNLILYKDVHDEYVFGKRSMHRKLNEMILAHRIETLLSKSEILVLYLNTIDFGRDTQGIKMAARVYFGKMPAELELHEMATLAALPKGPSLYNPDRNPSGLLERRNYVLTRMNIEGYITNEQMEEAKEKPLDVIARDNSRSILKNPYAGYYMSQLMNDIFSQQKTPQADSQNQISVPMDPELQKIAVKALQNELIARDKVMGRLTARFTGDGLPNIKERAKVKIMAGKGEAQAYSETVKSLPIYYPELSHFQRSVVMGDGNLVLSNGQVLKPTESHRKWMKRKNLKGEKESLKEGDIVFVDWNSNDGSFTIVGFPELTGAIIVLENSTGNVLATAGGFTLGANQRNLGPLSNQAFHSPRQPGSTLKPFLYYKALTEGFAPTTNIANTPISFPERYRNGKRQCVRWNPSAYSSNEASQVDLMNALTYSRNLASAHLLNLLAGDTSSMYPSSMLRIPTPQGALKEFSPLNQKLDELWDLLLRFGIYKDYPNFGPCFSSLLGAEETTVAQLASAYLTLANQGIRRTPHMFNLKDSMGTGEINLQLDPMATFQLRNILQNVVKQGTASGMAKHYKQVAGKTGTSNHNQDAWFAGFTKDITVVVWVGYPKSSRSLGKGGTGGGLALPIFKEFLEGYYQTYPDMESHLLPDVPPIPDGWREIRIEPRTGLLVDDEFRQVWFQATGHSQIPPAEIEYISPTQYQLFQKRIGLDPDNKEFWKLVFNYMLENKKTRIQRSFERTYEEYIRDARRAQDRCNRTQDYNDCRQVEALLRRIPSTFEFYYHNRDYFN